MTNKGIALIRLGVAAAIAFLVALAAKQGLPTLSPAAEDAVVAAIVAIVAPLYTNIVNYLEAHYPWLGILLGARYKPRPGTLGSSKRA